MSELDLMPPKYSTFEEKLMTKEIKWGKIPEEFGYYEVSSDGEHARNSKTGKPKKLQYREDGYVVLPAKKNGVQHTCYMHIMVADAFIPNPENKNEVHHKDGNRRNNCVDNLMRVTTEEHARLHNEQRCETNRKTKSIKVAQYTPDFPCELIKVWNSATEAARELRKQGIKIWSSNITKVCMHKVKTAGGFGWGYWEE